MTLETDIQQVRPFRNDYHKATVNIIFTGKWMMHFIFDLLKPYDVTPQQYNILRILRGKYPEAVTVEYIRERMLDRMSDASRTVSLLMRKGMIERSVCEKNRRRMDVLITLKGLTLLDEIENVNDVLMDRRLAQLNTQEIIQLNSLLDKLRNL